MQAGKTMALPEKLARILLPAQPYLPLLVFVSVLTGVPPLWVSWLVALLPLAARWFYTRRLLPRTPFDVPVLILTAGILLGFFLSPAPELAASALNTYFACLLFYYGLVANARTGRNYWFFLAAFVLLVFLGLAVIVFAGEDGKLVSFNRWIYNLGSALSFLPSINLSSNVMGVTFAVTLSALLSTAIFQQEPWLRWLAGTAAVICGSILVLSASGGGWIAAMTGVLFVLLARGVKVLFGTLLATAALAGVTFPLWYRADWIGAALPYQNLSARMDFWRATLEALRDHPFAGLGLGGWWSSVQTSITPGGPHSTYLQLYSDCGILGLMALAAATISGIILYRQLFRTREINSHYGTTVGLMATGVTLAALAFIDNIFLVQLPAGSRSLCFTVPLIWLVLALLSVTYLVLLDQRNIIQGEKQVENISRRRTHGSGYRYSCGPLFQHLPV